jgi:hypothetical protein
MSQLWFFVSIAFSFIAWGIVTARYIWPRLRLLPRSEALRPLLMLHSFRFEGLAFLVPGVVSPDLPSAFAHSAAYGDIVAFRVLLRRQSEPALRESRLPPDLQPSAVATLRASAGE